MEFLRIHEEDLELVLRWRTSEHVTKHMFTDIAYDLEQQKKWFENIQQDDNSHYWIMAVKGKKIGLVSIQSIHPVHKRASWAFYIGEPKYSMMAGTIGPHVYNVAFQTLKLHKLIGEVMAGNESVRKMHMMQGCREVGYYKDHIYKYGVYHDVYVYEMTASSWEQQPDRMKRFVPTIVR